MGRELVFGTRSEADFTEIGVHRKMTKAEVAWFSGERRGSPTGLTRPDGKAGAATIPQPGDRNGVRVVSGANEQSLPLGGKSVAVVKRALRDVFNIGYFADPIL